MSDIIAKALIHAAKLPYFISFEPDFGFTPEEGPDKYGVDFAASASLGNMSHFNDVSGENACVIGDFLNPETGNTDIAVSFRGTHPPAIANSSDVIKFIKDWEIDFKVVQKRCQFAPGMIHAGYQDAIESLWLEISTEIKNRLKANPGASIFVTGHSKGGALAFLGAYRIAAELKQIPTVYSFAAARAGDREFKAAYDKLIPNTWRYEYADDFVPHFPLQNQFAQAGDALWSSLAALVDKSIGLIDEFFHRGFLSVNELQAYLRQEVAYEYESVGRLRFIDAKTKTITEYRDDQTILQARVESLLKLLLTGQVLLIAEDHSIDPTNDGTLTRRLLGYYPAAVEGWTFIAS